MAGAAKLSSNITIGRAASSEQTGSSLTISVCQTILMHLLIWVLVSSLRKMVMT